MNNNTILVLMAGTLLTTTAVTMVPAAYAGNENEAEDESQAALPACDDNNVERAGFDCVAVAEIEEGAPPLHLTLKGSTIHRRRINQRYLSPWLTTRGVTTFFATLHSQPY